MASLANPLLLLQLAATLFLTGLVWFVQVAHYPLFARVGREEFARYCAENIRRTSYVAAPVMAIEVLTAVAMIWIRPAGVGLNVALGGLILLFIIWLSTFLVQFRLHLRFSRSQLSASGLWVLVWTNWLRTLAWTLRSIGLLLLVGERL